MLDASATPLASQPAKRPPGPLRLELLRPQANYPLA